VVGHTPSWLTPNTLIPLYDVPTFLTLARPVIVVAIIVVAAAVDNVVYRTVVL